MDITMKTFNHAKSLATNNMCGIAYNQEGQVEVKVDGVQVNDIKTKE